MQPASEIAYDRTLEIISQRWTIAILAALHESARRQRDLAAEVPGITGKGLAWRLRALTSEGLVERVVTSSLPVRIEYRLTAKGRSLLRVAEAVAVWARSWPSAAPPAPASGDDEVRHVQPSNLINLDD